MKQICQLHDVFQPQLVEDVSPVDVGGLGTDSEFASELLGRFSRSQLRHDLTFAAGEVVDDLAYVAAGAGGLRIVDVGDRADPRPLGAAPGASFAWSVAVNGEVAYVAANSGDGGWNGRLHCNARGHGA